DYKKAKSKGKGELRISNCEFRSVNCGFDSNSRKFAIRDSQFEIPISAIFNSPMPSVYDLKPKFQSLLRPLINTLARMGVTPNVVTIAALIGSLIVGAIVSMAGSKPLLLLLLPIWLFTRMALNAIDGMMARELKMATQLGAVLN